MITRKLEANIRDMLDIFPAVGIIGPRQVGKTTLAREGSWQHKKPILYLDMERPEDLAKLDVPELFFHENIDKLIVLDEIQRKPDIFPLLRGIIDENRRNNVNNGQFLILGSASVQLLRQSSESLAGRIGYVELSSFTVFELYNREGFDAHQLWLRGGFPSSYLAKNDASSLVWRGNFITTYLERDIPFFGLNAPAATLRRLWTMLAYNQGAQVNYSELAKSLDVSSPTVKRYIDFLEELFLVRSLVPWAGNISKRLVKSPKVYIRDSGLVHALLGIQDMNQLLGHPVNGASWEGWVIENVLAYLPANALYSYYRSSGGAEIDLFIEIGMRRIAIEIKRNTVPRLSKGFYQGCQDVGATEKYVVYGGADNYSLRDNIQVVSVYKMVEIILS